MPTLRPSPIQLLRKALELDDDDIGPRGVWQAETSRQLVTMYLHNGRTFLLLEWKQDMGWEIYIPAAEDNTISTSMGVLKTHLEDGAPGSSLSFVEKHSEDCTCLSCARTVNDPDPIEEPVDMALRIHRSVRFQLRQRGDIWSGLETLLQKMIVKKRAGGDMATDVLDHIRRKLIVSGQASLSPAEAESPIDTSFLDPLEGEDPVDAIPVEVIEDVLAPDGALLDRVRALVGTGKTDTTGAALAILHAIRGHLGLDDIDMEDDDEG